MRNQPYSPILDAVMDLIGVPAHEKAIYQQKFKAEQQQKIHPHSLRMVPISEYFARRKHTQTVAARIARLNPNGFEEGNLIRGWHPKIRSNFFIDVLPLRQYIERWGTADGAVIGHKSGRWKFVTRRSYLEGP